MYTQHWGATKWQPRLVAVSKFKSEQQVRELYDGGVRCFGESRIEELVSKARSVPDSAAAH